MRPFKSFVSLPITNSILLVWSRITLSRLTLIYFLFSFLHASLQIILQAEVFSVNSQAASLLGAIVAAGDPTSAGFSVLEGNQLLWCRDPTRIPSSCTVLWSALDAPSPSSDYPPSTPITTTASSLPPSSLSPPLPQQTANPISPSVSVQPTTANQTGPQGLARRDSTNSDPIASQPKSVVLLSEFPGMPANQTLNPQCLTALQWPLETLRNTKREDIVFLFFHVWVLGMSIVALLNESVVHMLATLVTHALLTAWSIFQILTTRAFQNNFSSIITRSACRGSHLLVSYWKERTMVEIPAAALNGTALILSAFLTWRLVLTYNWATFKRIGANRKVSKAYKSVLTFSVALQLSLFFIVVSMALWIDQLCNGAIAVFAINMQLYRGIYITVMVFLIPWIIVGWKAVRKEQRILMAGFVAFDVLLIGGWASMFASTTFRLTFMQWRFFAVMSVVALLLTLSCLVFGVMCRLNFGNDLKRHLSGQEPLPAGFVAVTPGDRESVYSYEEKVAFPEATLPSFTRSHSRGGAPTLTRNISASSEGGISRPIFVPKSRFSMDSSDGDTTENQGGHRRNESGQSGFSKRRWLIE